MQPMNFLSSKLESMPLMAHYSNPTSVQQKPLLWFILLAKLFFPTFICWCLSLAKYQQAVLDNRYRASVLWNVTT